VTPDNRKGLRQKILARRDALPADDRRVKSAAIHQKLWELEEFRSAKNIMVYINFRSEVETLPLVEECLRRNIKVSAPLTITTPPRLIPYPLNDPAKDLRPGYCNILEPDTERLMPQIPAEIDVVLLPGSVFDAHGGRLGYGGGYYDRFLAHEAPRALRIAIAFEEQVVDRVPVLDHDIPLHYLVTEKRIIKIEHKANHP
jgi:5-formyltetrahydrofolate cyclo-ligase